MIIRWHTLPVFFVALVSSSAATPEDPRRVQDDVRSVISALYSGDVETVLEFTHPWVIKQMGGATAARTSVLVVIRQTQEAGLRLEHLSFPERPRFVRGARRLFAVVPTFAVLKGRGGVVESRNFQLGILDDGSSQWTYFEGSRLTPQVRGAAFPDFPKDFNLPVVERKRR